MVVDHLWSDTLFVVTLLTLLISKVDGIITRLSFHVLEVESVLLFGLINAGHNVFGAHAWIGLNHEFVFIEVKISGVKESFKTVLKTGIGQSFYRG